MKTNINFYHDEFRPRFDWVSGQHLSVLLVLSFVLCGSIYAGLYAWRGSVQADLEQIAQSVQQQQSNIDEFTFALQNRENNPVLSARLRQLQLQILSQENRLKKVQDMGEMKQSSFAELFDALATANSDHVWINNFTVNEEDLIISGSIAKPSALTKWIGDLSKTQFFKGQEFDDALLQREDGELSFQLTSTEKPRDLLLANGNNPQSTMASGGDNAKQ
jgi:Tfp pilus assembly protein PilN